MVIKASPLDRAAPEHKERNVGKVCWHFGTPCSINNFLFYGMTGQLKENLAGLTKSSTQRHVILMNGKNHTMKCNFADE